MVGGEDVGSGRLVLLHDPAGNAAWGGTFRLVTFARAEVDPEMVTDPLYREVVKHRQAGVEDSRLIRMSPIEPGEGFGE